MMNVGENRVRNGVRECSESKNEENFLSIELMASSRYGEASLRVLDGTRWTKISKIPPDFFAVREAFFGSSSRYATVEAVEKVDIFHQIHAEYLDFERNDIVRIVDYCLDNDIEMFTYSPLIHCHTGNRYVLVQFFDTLPHWQ
ncbi:hypothetical protein E3N88_10082 [Mikania micrantha]|uniref:Uncharacterized protein n=1 Tax=Mikania micrantha TaxID=192012 RepID=A0A5N6P9G8_9ASTR|nr:hypothetical protein E3N88_10082 [Mikania micrantha]